MTARTTGHTEAVEMYLKSLAVLGAAERPVPVVQLALRLGLTPAAANEMLRRLVREKLVGHEPYRGFGLTEAGRAVAWDVIRRERVWERFLVDHLALDSTLAAGWACLLEHATAPEVIDALDAYLGHPATCPQGQPIPRSLDDPVRHDGRPLADVDAGETVRLDAFDDEDPEVLGYLRRHGLTIGTTVRVTEVGPRRSLLAIETPDTTAVIGRDVAATIQTSPVVAAPAGAAGSPP